MDKLPHFDYREAFKACNIDTNSLCPKCGDVFLTDIDDKGNVCGKCHNCGEIQ